MVFPQAAAPWVGRLLAAFSALMVMLLLKRHYSLAGADQLHWILAPTARLVAWLTPAQPVFESGVGYVDFAHGLIIAPVCAGINFMIMAFGLAVYCGLPHLTRLWDQVAWLVIAAGLAYAGTLGINTLRIILSMHLYGLDLPWGGLTPARLHRLAGIGVYLTALWALYPVSIALAQRLAGRTGLNSPWMPKWLPPAWYLAGTVGVPILNLLFQRPEPGLLEHCLTLAAASLAVWGTVKVVSMARGVLN